uniref:NADH-ubiquinone oxidoreductase chain 5 n=1 Tax=Graphocaecilius interpretatus TaxID=2596997 RepID=A0A8K1ZFL4_9NEOP|nr:NADH dehydrogenase subunit 5 [Graphocaecilius interpretatus]
MKYNFALIVSSLLFLMSLNFFLIFIYLCLYNSSYLIDFEVLYMNSKVVSMSIYMDWMSSSFMSFVFLISFSVVIYSISYMGSDKYIGMFLLLVFCFVISMALLIISPNLISLLLGWDGLGLISYCLVIYYQNIKSYNAGMLTAMSNRVGDVMILLSIAWMLNFGSWNYLFYFNYEENLFFIIGIMIMLAAMTKSAQIPFSSWLPAAMAAPTPVSALVHSSTLVTAGVYLLIRFNKIFMNYYICMFMLIISVLTMFMSGLGAVFETDLKKIIALSTLSQLGLMISTLSIGMYNYAFFHLLSHALFKSLLFMCAGYIIHNMKDCQDIRFMGCVLNQSPLLNVNFNMSNLSLCGMPFLAGFYSKDLILENILMSNMNLFMIFLYFLSTFFTVVYTFRLIYFSMVNNFNLFSFYNFHSNDFLMIVMMSLMLIMVIFGGSFMSWMIFLDFEGIYLPMNLKLFTLMICLMGCMFGFILGFNKLMMKTNLKLIYIKNILGEMWFLPYLSTYSVNLLVLKLGYFYIKLFDLGWGEYLGGQGLYKSLVNSGGLLMYFKTTNMMNIIFIFMIFIMYMYML